VGTLLAGTVGYLLGCLPFGVLFGRLSGFGDVRQYGSGKTGVTNSLRTMGWRWAVLVVAGDVLKGVGAVAIGRFVFDEPAAGALASGGARGRGGRADGLGRRAGGRVRLGRASRGRGGGRRRRLRARVPGLHRLPGWSRGGDGLRRVCRRRAAGRADRARRVAR